MSKFKSFLKIKSVNKRTLLPFIVLLAGIVAITDVSIIKNYQKEEEEKNSPRYIASGIKDGCTDDAQWRTCYAGKFQELTTLHGFEFTLNILHEFQEIEPKARDCHLIAHRMSTAEVKKNPQSWKEFLGKASADECIGGFIHGAIEAYQKSDPSLEFNAKTIEEICSLTKTTGKSYCSHMMGHLLPVETVGNFKKAVDVCYGLSKEMQFNCFTGVFMENITRDNLADHGLAEHIPYSEESTAGQEKLCRQFTGEPARGCWQEITHYYQRLELGNPKGLFKRCSRADAPDGRDSCFLHGITFMAGADPSELKNNNMFSLCDPFALRQKGRMKQCISTIIHVLFNSSPKFEERVGELCSDIPSELREFCGKTVEKVKNNKLEDQNIDSNSQ